MKVEFTETPEGVKFRSGAEVIMKLRFIKDNLTYQQVFSHYNLLWLSKDTHQLSCVFHASKRDAHGRPVEAHPSARYYADDKQIWCFACAEGGDVSWFIKKKEDHLNYGQTIDYVRQHFGIALNESDLLQRIALYERTQTPEEASRRQIVAEMYSDKVNDEFHRLRALGKNKPESVFCQMADRIEQTVFVKKAEMDACEANYVDYTRQLRRWFDWTLELITAAMKHAAKR